MSLSCTSAALQFLHLPNHVSFPLHEEMKLQIRLHYELTKNCTRSLSHRQFKRLVATIERAICSCSCNGRTWDWCTKQRIFSLDSLQFSYFHFSIPLVDRVEYLQNVAKMWTLQTIKYKFLVGPYVLRHQTLRTCVKFQQKEWFNNAEPLCEEVGNSFVQYASKFRKIV
jgi:hypothetical protein